MNYEPTETSIPITGPFHSNLAQTESASSPASQPPPPTVYLLTPTCWHACRHTCMHTHTHTQHLMRQVLEVAPTNHKHGQELTIRSTKYTTDPCTMLQSYHHTLQNLAHTDAVGTAWQQHPTTTNVPPSIDTPSQATSHLVLVTTPHHKQRPTW